MIVAVAKDEAFNFAYSTNIQDLSQLGEIVYFSPLHDGLLPTCDLLYLPGGYPELYAQQLSENCTMRNNIKSFAENGGLIFAECGGFMYLCNNIDGVEMCGVFPYKATMDNARLHLGYREMELNGTLLRGHEFHYSAIQQEEQHSGITIQQVQRTAKGTKAATPIYRYKNVIAGYTHWYWAESGFQKTWLKELNRK